MKLTVIEYLAKKLEMLGIRDVFGLPGDYNFNILDGIIKSEKLNWVNCTNELNAGFVSDGYARINGYGAVVTTYGVGELSAINAIAGAYAENLPVIHIAGVPKTSFIKNNVAVHHNFAHVDYFVFEKIYKNVTAASAYLTAENAKNEIDRVIDVMVNTKLPVYIAIPVDVCCECIDDEGYDKINYIKSDEINLKRAADKIIELVNSACCPVFYIDYLVKRFNLQNQLKMLIEKTGANFSTFLMGKGALDENLPSFLGVNAGSFSGRMPKSDLLIAIGFLNADLNTGGFTVFIDKKPDISIEKDFVEISGEKYSDILIQDIIPLICQGITKKFHFQKAAAPKIQTREGKLTSGSILPKLNTLFEENDIFVMETGLLSLAGSFLKLKPNMEYLSQTLWGSIGWATPASFGAMMADKNRNLILYTGEGAHQLTVQEIANFFENDLKPVIFVLNNAGYTVERVLSKDPMDKFNDITCWDYSKIPSVFNNGREYYYDKIYSIEDFDRVLGEIKKFKGKKLCYIEIFTDKMDIIEFGPKLVQNMAKFGENLPK